MLVRQLFIDARGCRGTLDDRQKLTEAMKRGIARVGARIVGDCVQAFVPHGLTIVFILAESHFIVSTWPEHDYVTVDILLCNETMDALLVWQELKEALEPDQEELQWIVRSVDEPVKPAAPAVRFQPTAAEPHFSRR